MNRRTRRGSVENRKDRLELATDAGHGRLSGPSVAAGVLGAFGMFAVVLGVAVAVVQAVGVDARSFTRADWRALGVGSGIAAAIVAMGAWGFGGYVVGRMARRAGARHGLLVFGVSIAMLAAAAGIVWAEHGTGTIRDALRHQGAPTARGDWWDVAALSGVLTFVGALSGSLLGAIRGERWHQHLVERALDPAYGPTAVTPTPATVAEERQWVAGARATTRPDVDLPAAETVERPATSPVTTPARPLENRDEDRETAVPWHRG